MRILARLLLSAVVIVMFFILAAPGSAQTETATVSGRITDSQGQVVPDVEVQLVNVDTNIASTTKTNSEGLYAIPNVHPGPYRILVLKDGFKEIVKTGLTLNVQDSVVENFSLQVGSVSESVTVTADQLNVNTTDASVSTIVDRQFAENLPMNGRSFQTLIQLTPGVVITPSNAYDSGQFSANGQRASSNYWMVDGVSANFGTGVSIIGTASNGLGGALASFSAQGGTNSLVSVDAVQEFRIQTSTFAPEFGRTPGGQISIVTRSGTNQFHGTMFDYFRNDILDANDWFADSASLPKPEERQNDFGGTFSGPILKDRTFFFFSYEGLRLRLPQVALDTVPDVAARQNAIPAMQPYLNAFPLPNGTDLGNGIAQYNASYSNSSTLDASSIRVDHKLSNKLTLFGRYNYSPSETVQRGNGVSLNTVSPSRITTQTATIGLTWSLSPTVVDDLRFNYSRGNAYSYTYLDTFGGAVPPLSLPFPAPFTSENALFEVGIYSLTNGFITQGSSGRYLQRQINLVDNLSAQTGSHSLKFGLDLRRLSPVIGNRLYTQDASFLDLASAEGGNLYFSSLTSGLSTTLLFRNLGVFAQDTWRILPRLTLTYGMRWDVDFTPASLNGPDLPAVTGFNLANFSNLALAPTGTPAFKTTYGNVAPRVGMAYVLSRSPDWGLVMRGGFGVFYDLATSEVGNTNFEYSYPFGASQFNCCFNGTFPLDPATAAPPPITQNLSSGTLLAFDPSLKLPYTLQWNVAFEQALGKQQTITASYVGAVGRRLLQTAYIESPNSNIGSAQLVANSAQSDYEALQLQFQRRLSHGLQALASYTWSHSIDTASAGSVYGDEANALVPGINPNSNRGPSDFDVRDSFSAGLTYELPVLAARTVANSILHGWSTDNIIQARSSLPVNVYDGVFNQLFQSNAEVRPDVVPGQPFYLYGAQYPGGKALNPAAFIAPPTDANGNPLQQGDLGRNALRGFGAVQWDFAVHRDFPIHDLLKLQFRAEMFNVLNHPNFAQPIGDISNPQFGLSTQMLSRSLDQNPSGGSFSALYQIGGPRSIQLALKLMF